MERSPDLWSPVPESAKPGDTWACPAPWASTHCLPCFCTLQPWPLLVPECQASATPHTEPSSNLTTCPGPGPLAHCPSTCPAHPSLVGPLCRHFPDSGESPKPHAHHRQGPRCELLAALGLALICPVPYKHPLKAVWVTPQGLQAWVHGEKREPAAERPSCSHVPATSSQPRADHTSQRSVPTLSQGTRLSRPCTAVPLPPPRRLPAQNENEHQSWHHQRTAKLCAVWAVGSGRSAQSLGSRTRAHLRRLPATQARTPAGGQGL